MNKGHHAVDIRVIRHLLGPEGGGNHPRRCRRTVHRGQDADIVSRPDPPILAPEPHEFVAASLANRPRRPQIGRKFIIRIGIAERHVVNMDMRASGNILTSIADHLRIFADRFTCRDGACGEFVVARDDRLRDGSLDREAGFERLCRCHHIVAGIKPDCF